MCMLRLLVLLVVDLLLLVSFFCTNTVFDVFQDAGMLFSFCIILFIMSVKMLIQCMSFPRIFNKSGFIPSGPADFFSFNFFICRVTSSVVICGSSMYPIYLTFATISLSSCSLYCTSSIFCYCFISFILGAVKFSNTSKLSEILLF